MTEAEHEFRRGERVYLGRSRSPENESLHLDRYRFALDFVQSGHVVLDAACGSGYGTELLAQKAARVVGLEISEHALTYARQHHNHSNVAYERADLNLAIQLPDQFFDVIVSFETLEHIDQQPRMLAEFRRLLKPAGVVIVSTPDHEARIFGNRFHVHELTRAEFLNLVSRSFIVQALYGQVNVSQSPWRTPLRWLAALDVFELRNTRAGSRGIVQRLRRKLRPDTLPPEGSSIVITTLDARRSHMYLIVVATMAPANSH